MPSKKVSVLIVDDDVWILRMVQRILELEGYRVLKACNAESALKVFEEENPNLVLLDIMMPAIDGYTLFKRIREFSRVPIIMVTAKMSDEEKVYGLDIGADDYITKPFSANELAARVRAALRRNELVDKPAEPVFCCRDLLIDYARHQVSLGNSEVKLTAIEYRLLTYLAHNANRVVVPNQILENVWGTEYLSETHLLQVNIARLRRKLQDNARNPTYILTKPGIGYMMCKT